MITVAATYPMVRPIILLASLSPVIVMSETFGLLLDVAGVVRAGDEGRKDVCGGKHGTLFPHFVMIENETSGGV